MHEHGLADRIVESVLLRSARPQCHTAGQADARPLSVTVLVAELGGLDEAALQAGVDHVCDHEGLPHIDLHVQVVPLLGECRACCQTGAISEELTCAACGSSDVRLCGGETVVVREVQFG
jgi:Zn finger protein HypA/HybF involved in hydrogenase expression